MHKTPTKTITKEQLLQLFQFVSKHYVEFFDVQIELVDHLANDIEQQWIMEPTVSFDDALHIAFKRFGIFGFTDLVSKKVDTLSTEYYKKTLHRLLEYISWPKIVLTIVLYLIIYFSLYNLEDAFPLRTYAKSFIFTLNFLGLGCIVYFSIQNKKERKQGKMKLLLDDAMMNIIVVPTLSSYFILDYLFTFTGDNLFAASFIILFIGMTVFILATHIIPGIKKERSRLQAQLAKNYQQTLVQSI